VDTGVWLTKSRADIRIQCLCIDTNDPAKTAQFWQAALGWRRTFDEEDQIVLEPPEGSPEDGIVPDLLFLRVPEAKAAKNRWHLDVRVGPENVVAEKERLVARGATYRYDGQQGPHTWVTMADPEGNEFCLS
jgi:catechol 2,3-dioxygenase-like lactoylglutathione lyase family enzyme